MSCAAPSWLSRQSDVPGRAFSALMPSLYGGPKGGSVEVVVVDCVVEDGDGAAAPSSPFPPSCHATTVASATTAAPATAKQRCRRRRRWRSVRRCRLDGGGR